MPAESTFRDVHHHDADPATVHGMLVDPEFRRRATTRMRALEAFVDAGTDASGAETVVTRWTMPTEGAPDVVRRFIGDRLAVMQRTVWAAPDGRPGRHARTTVDLSGVPVSVEGRIVLEADGAGTTQVVETRVTSSVPLLGSRITAAAGPLLSRAIKAEHAEGVEWLAGR